MAQQLIASLSSEFEPTKYKDEYRERVLELIERKAAGEEIAVQPQAEEPAAAPDLMAALEASLAAVKADSDDTPAPATREAAQARLGRQGDDGLGIQAGEAPRQGQALTLARRARRPDRRLRTRSPTLVGRL